MSTHDEPQTFRIPDFPPEADPTALFCETCGVVAMDEDCVGCESCGQAAHRDTCAVPFDRGDGTWICKGCRENYGDPL